MTAAGGGAGATFWLIVAGFLGMSTKFVECTLGVKYRNEDPDGSVSGGPMYYLTRGFAERGMPGFGRALGTFYAIGIFVGALGIGNVYQSNQAYVQLNSVSGGALDGLGWLAGLALAGMISWSYYGPKGWTYLLGEDAMGQTVYKLIFCAFVTLCCIVQLGPILDISDALVFLICVPNILGLYVLAPIVKREMGSYFERLRSGEIKKYRNA
ncbi:MAG: alanine:cation symporter family protein [Hyphomicrobiaceae bacterium]